MAGTRKFPAFLLLTFVLTTYFSVTALAKSPRPITDEEIKEKKDVCYADIESGLWGWKCKWSVIEKENCALRCLSPVCYDLIYGSDPLEEGEKDYIRSQEFKYCMHNYCRGLTTAYTQMGCAELVQAVGKGLYNLYDSGCLFFLLSLGESLQGVKGSFDY